MRRLERLVAIALFVGVRRRVLARDISEKFGVGLRTVYRDMRALQDAGFPVEGNAGDGYRLPQESYLRPLALRPDEAEVLTIAAHALSASATDTMRESLARAVGKLEASLDASARRSVLQLESRIVVTSLSKRTSAPSAEMLESIRERHVARLTYVEGSSGKRSGRDVEPLGFVCRGDAWWLIAFCKRRKDARAFRVDWIEKWKTNMVTFPPRDGFSFAEIVARDRHLAERLFGY
jgi:predicted DNA-binding transcriptional regulator YafY